MTPTNFRRRPLRFSHRVGRCRWSRTRAAALIWPILQGSRVTRSSAFQVRLSRALACSAGCAEGADEGVAGPVVGIEVVTSDWDLDADSGADVALVGQGR